MYAGGIMPIILKNRMVKNESHQPRKNKLGPRVPVFISAILIDNHTEGKRGHRQICTHPDGKVVVRVLGS
jgi:hypothetical protein